MMQSREAGASIVIPVLNRLAFTRQCLDRIARHTGDVAHEVIIVDNGSTDGTQSYFSRAVDTMGLTYLRNDRNLGFARASNLGARAAKYEHLLFLNNDTLVAPGWLGEMMALRQADPRIGIVGIKQLFPYTRTVYHSGIVFTRGPRPIHLYPHADGNAAHVNRQREYQAVSGACLLIDAELFAACGGFDEEYINGYEDVDLCLAVRQRGLKVVCCTSAYIYHYAQTSEGRTDDDERNLARLVSKWRHAVRVDEDDYFRADARDLARSDRDPEVKQRQADRVSSRERGLSSPYWRGTRISVIIPVRNHGEFLRAQLQTLAGQTILPEEFEVLVVDYGSGEARQAVKQDFGFAAHYCRCGDPRAGSARNEGVGHARGELVLFLGEDCVPGERLLEEHLLAHAHAPDPRTAAVGQLEWSTPVARRTLLEEVFRPSVPVFDHPARGEAAVFELARLDVANASFKRRFLADAWESGICLDPSLTLSCFQGADLAIRLQPRGLRIRDAPDARAYQNPPERIDSLLSREYAAGADAFALNRRHPALAAVLDVTWIADSETSLRRGAGHPRLRQAVADLSANADGLLLTLVRGLDELRKVARESPADAAAIGVGDRRLIGAAQAALGLARDVRRTTGKVRAWYEHAPDRELSEAAEQLIAATRTIEWLAARVAPGAAIGSGAGAAGSEHTSALVGNRPDELERGIPTRRGLSRSRSRTGVIRSVVIFAASRTRMKSRLRAIDAFIEARLSRRKNGRWLARYLALRARLRPFVA